MTGAVLWDMDGTLVDSEEYHWLSWRDTMASEGVAITHDQFLKTFRAAERFHPSAMAQGRGIG